MIALRVGLAAALAAFAVFAGPLLVEAAWLRAVVIALGLLLVIAGAIRLRRRDRQAAMLTGEKKTAEDQAAAPRRR